MENKMKEVAKLLGVELEEEFKIESYRCKYKLTNDGLMYWSNNLQRWYTTSIIGELLTGESQIIKQPKPILNDIEKEYLSNIIKPFRDRIDYIAKFNLAKVNLANRREYILIKMKNCEMISLPFTAGTVYKGMENDKNYTLKDLGL